MPTSSNLNQNSGGEIEDIFAGADTGQPPVALPTEVSAAVVNEPVLDDPASQTKSTYTPPVDTGRRKRLFLLIAIVIGSLLLLGGIAWAVMYWVKSSNNSGDNTNASPLNINSAVNENQSPINIVVNTNTTTNSNTNPADTFIDSDHDGLSDQEELIANTNPKKKDTDDDGLSDREEVRVYLTDPRNPDTDDDGYADGTEVANFYHPNDPDPKKRLFDLPN
ncbi:MAG: hypothetical protein ACD_43C00285G0001 [uncultured bacterium]|nr:MAG: hypothetical protein ACD_43C00285G0001 [uncultured bacterium]